MKQDTYAHVRSINWPDICPWLNIFRSVQVAISFRVLLLGAVGLFLMALGQNVIQSVLNEYPSNYVTPFLGNSTTVTVGEGDEAKEVPVNSDAKTCPWTLSDRLIPQSPIPAVIPNPETPTATDSAVSEPVVSNWLKLSDPIFTIFSKQTSFVHWVAAILYGFWLLLVWGLIGGAICRIATVQLAVGERVGLVESVRFSLRKLLSFMGAPFMPILASAIIVLICGLLGVLIAIPYIGPFVIALLFYPLLLIAGFVLAVLLLGLVFGWPLMWGTIATEGTDGFDALSRSYAYTFQRPLRYLFYVIVATILGWLSWMLLSHFTAAIIDLTERAYLVVLALFTDTGKYAQDQLGISGDIMNFWLTAAKWIACGFIFSYFWTAVCGIYLTLRRDVDARELDEVYLEEPEEDLPVEEEEEKSEAPAETPAGDEAAGGESTEEESDEPVVLEETPEETPSEESTDEEPPKTE